MAIWYGDFTLEQANARCANTAIEHLGIEITEIGEDHLSGRMPVDHRTHQPMGLLHGGASVLLAETLASWGAMGVIDPSRFGCVGQEINANHVRGVRSGWVTGTARPLHLGRSSHVWEVRIVNEEGKLVCVSRVTMAVVPHPG